VGPRERGERGRAPASRRKAADKTTIAQSDRSKATARVPGEGPRERSEAGIDGELRVTAVADKTTVAQSDRSEAAARDAKPTTTMRVAVGR
jgi:hypothetical protein